MGIDMLENLSPGDKLYLLPGKIVLSGTINIPNKVKIIGSAFPEKKLKYNPDRLYRPGPFPERERMNNNDPQTGMRRRASDF